MTLIVSSISIAFLRVAAETGMRGAFIDVISLAIYCMILPASVPASCRNTVHVHLRLRL